MTLDLKPALRDAIMDYPLVTDELSEYKGEAAIFTRRPVPSDAEYPFVQINHPSAIGDRDGLNSDRPVVVIDIMVYGDVGEPGTPQDQTRAVDRAAYALRELFHRQRKSVQPDGFYAISITARGPMPAPVDDEKTVGRVVSLTIALRREV